MQIILSKTNPVISIITVVFNDVKNIENTLLSIINQTYLNFDFIIIDGGSSDGTVDIIKKYENKISYWISEPDKGIYDAMNKGIEKAKGEWILFMNSGDIFCHNDVIHSFKKHFSSELNLIYGDAYFKFKSPYRLKYFKAKKFEIIKYKIPFCHQSVFVRTELLKKYKFNLSFKVASDFDFFLNLYKNKIYCYERISVPVCIYDLNGVSNSIQTLKEYFSITQKYYPYSFISLYSFFRIIMFSIKGKIKKIIPKTMLKKNKTIYELTSSIFIKW